MHLEGDEGNDTPGFGASLRSETSQEGADEFMSDNTVTPGTLGGLELSGVGGLLASGNLMSSSPMDPMSVRLGLLPDQTPPLTMSDLPTSGRSNLLSSQMDAPP